LLRRKTIGNGLTTYIGYLETINRTEGQRGIFGIHRAGEEKGDCQDLGLNIFLLFILDHISQLFEQRLLVFGMIV
jgi:hypothetical protein